MTILEGLDDIVLVLFALVAAGVLAAGRLALIAIGALAETVPTRPGIHPDSADVVGEIRRRRDDSGTDQLGVAERPAFNGSCPVCLDDLDAPVTTNCGHAFCAGCFEAMHRASPGLQVCPICRGRVTLVMGSFSLAPASAAACIRQYNRRYSTISRSWAEQLFDAPVVISERVRAMTAAEAFVLMVQTRIGVTAITVVLYALSPLDIIPEAVFGPLGLLDDLAVMVMGSILVSNVLRQVGLLDD